MRCATIPISMEKERKIFLVTPLWNYGCPTKSARFTKVKANQLKAVSNYVKKLVRQQGYTLTSISDIAAVTSFSDAEIIEMSQEPEWREMIMDNCRLEISESDIILFFAQMPADDELVKQCLLLASSKGIPVYHVDTFLNLVRSEFARKIKEKEDEILNKDRADQAKRQHKRSFVRGGRGR